MRDELNRKNKITKNECLILNIDHSANEGTHWTCLFVRNSSSYYFDSYGHPPPLEIEQYCKEPRVYNSFSIQKPNEVICGHYCIYVLSRMSNGDDYDDILDELYRYNH